MIFVVTKEDPPSLFLMLSEQDVAGKLRPGNTLYVDRSMLKGVTFAAVVVSLGKTEAANMAILEQADPTVKGMTLVQKEQGAGEDTCNSCEGVMPGYQLFRGKCIVCWANLAEKLQAGRN